MPGKGMTCWDKRELCDLNCVYATTQATEDSPTLAECSTGCMTAQTSCTDSDETVAYVAVSLSSIRVCCGRETGGGWTVAVAKLDVLPFFLAALLKKQYAPHKLLLVLDTGKSKGIVLFLFFSFVFSTDVLEECS